MSYSSIDPIINAWTQRHGFTLFTRNEAHEDSIYRAIYTSSPDGECCQIWIEPPKNGRVGLHVVAIEARDDEEMMKDWRVPILELGEALEHAVSFVKTWMARES
jgi:hypothetical protein